MACPSASTCVVQGYSHDSSGDYHGMLLTGSGTSWTPAEAPVPNGNFAVTQDVACPATTSCVVTGYYTDPTGNTQGLLLTGRGTSWTTRKAPLPTGAAANPNALIGSITCPITTVCVTTRPYNDSKGNTQGVLLTGPA